MTLEDFEAKLGPSSKWTKAQWREVALTLLTPGQPGRPSTATELDSQTVNVQALAWMVKERLDKESGLEVKAALESVLTEIIKRDRNPPSEHALKSDLKTYVKRTYSRVVNQLKEWRYK